MTIEGVVIGAAISLTAAMLGLLISHNLEIKKIKFEEQLKKKDTSLKEIFSPLIFIINKNRDFFVKVHALNRTFNKFDTTTLNEKQIEEIRDALLFLSSSYDYPKDLKNLLYNKLYLITDVDVYMDTNIYTSYLNDVYAYYVYISSKDVNTVKEVIQKMIPIIKVLDEASDNLYQYAIAQTLHNEKYSYLLYFTKSRMEKMDKLVNDLNISVLGEPVIEWEKLYDKNNK